MMETDFFCIINDLNRHGMTFRQMSLEVGASPASVHNWKMGVCEPPYSAGERLCELHRAVVQST